MPCSSKQSARPATRGKPRPQMVRSLAADEVRRLPKPIINYEELVAKAIAAWKGVSGLKASGLTAARLATLLRRMGPFAHAKGSAAQAKETKLRQRVAPALTRRPRSARPTPTPTPGT